METLAELAASRRDWIENVLRPWCAIASLKELKLAEAEWTDIAGRIDADSTLWTWAWSRFPVLVHEGLSGVNETHEVAVTLKDGSTRSGYPDNRKSTGGKLVLVLTGAGTDRRLTETAPVSIDDIAAVERTTESIDNTARRQPDSPAP